jgi:hypothetical protein
VALALVPPPTPTSAVQAQDLVVGGYSEARTGNPWNLYGSYLSQFRASLADPANFGPGGTVPRTVRLAPPTDVASATTLAGTDVFLIGYVPTFTFTPEERQALRDFAVAGGNLIVSADDVDHSVVDVFGLTQADAGGNTLTVTDPGSPLAAGPFGTATTIQGALSTGFFPSLGPDALPVASNAGGVALAVIPPGRLGPRSGTVVLVADIDVLSNSGQFPNGGAAANAGFIGNLVTYAGLLPQTITFAQPAPFAVGDAPQALSATAEGGAVSFAVASGPCSITAEGRLAAADAGTCEVVASQPGNATYRAAAPVTRTVTVTRPPAPAAVAPPAPAPCRSTRAPRITIALGAPKGVRIRRATIAVDGRVVRTLRAGERSAVVAFTGRTASRSVVTITATTTTGRTLRGTRAYLLCGFQGAPSQRLMPLRPVARR